MLARAARSQTCHGEATRSGSPQARHYARAVAEALRYGVRALRCPVRAWLGVGAPSRAERLLRPLLAAAVACCAAMVIANFIIAPLLGRFSGGFVDFGPLLYAGRAANGGSDIYGAFMPHSANELVGNLGFDYLPFIAVLMRPLAAMPYRVAEVIWLWIILGCLIAGSIILAREVLPSSLPRTAIALCVAVFFAPAIDNVWQGQMNAVVFLFVALGLRSWRRGDELACGIALGLGGVAKVAPAVLLLLLLRRRWWRGFAAGAGVLALSLAASGVVVGFNEVREWFTGVLPVLSRADGWLFNQSAGALLSRLADHNVWRVDAPSGALQATSLLISALLLGAAVWNVRSGEASPDRRALEFAGAVVAMMLAGAITWYSSYCVLAIPLLIVAGLALRGHVSRAVIACASLGFAAVGIAVPAFLAVRGLNWVTSTYGSRAWWLALQVDSVPAYAALLFAVALLVSLGRRRSESGAAAGRLATAAA